jgi:hypothetical protein
MSRAFVNEDSGNEPDPHFDLPEPSSPYYPEASAWALLQGADAGDSRSAELATGYTWGDKRLIEHIERILDRARREEEHRLALLARRFLRAARD